jgi:hypothetical protein
MGRFVILLIIPIVIGLFIAAAVVVINGLRDRRVDARRALLEASPPDGVFSPTDATGTEESSHPTHRRIAS